MTTDGELERDPTVDALRGVAVVTMVWGHLGVAIYHPQGQGQPSTTLDAVPPLWTEVVGGLAPPLFLFVCGMMVQASIDLRGGRLKRQLLRMVVLLAIGAAIDTLFWRIRPFTTVDVLYCIALALPLTHLFAAHVRAPSKWLVSALVLTATPVLQRALGYSDYPIEMSLSGRVFVEVPNQTSILNHWIVDGWFPLFPWLGFSLLGAASEARRRTRRHPSRQLGIDRATMGAAALALSGSLFLGWPDASARIEARLFAGGAFMPPDAGYLLASVGAVLALVTVLDALPPAAALGPVRLLGRHPLFLYVTHFPAVKLATKLLPHRLTLAPTIAVLLVTLAALGGAGTLSRRLLRAARARLQSPSPRTRGVDGSRK